MKNILMILATLAVTVPSVMRVMHTPIAVQPCPEDESCGDEQQGDGSE